VKKGRILVGDYVDIEPNEYDKGKFIITGVKKRKNSIPRPLIANVDKLIIVVSPKPEPDFFLVDKLVIYCVQNNIEPVIVINKCDLGVDELKASIENQYQNISVFLVSASTGFGIDILCQFIEGSICAVCGQSAVGKSSLINKLIPNIDLETQGLSRKIDRGKHTTRANELYFYDKIIVADTPGFSSLELNIDYDELMEYYPEFEKYRENCKYLDCSHIGEGDDCGIISAVKDGTINKNRYIRYCELYKTLKDKWERKYD